MKLVIDQRLLSLNFQQLTGVGINFNRLISKPKQLSFEKPIEHKTEKLIPIASLVQQKLEAIDIKSLIAGGLATDLLAGTYLKGHQHRTHKDIDIMVPRNSLHSYSIKAIMEELGFLELREDHGKSIRGAEFFESRERGNLRVFKNEDDVRIDIMGYYPTLHSNIGDFPAMSWGEIDSRRTPAEIDLQPVLLEINGLSLGIMSPKSLLKMKKFQGHGSIIPESGDHIKRDVAILEQLIST